MQNNRKLDRAIPVQMNRTWSANPVNELGHQDRRSGLIGKISSRLLLHFYPSFCPTTKYLICCHVTYARGDLVQDSEDRTACDYVYTKYSSYAYIYPNLVVKYTDHYVY